MRIALHKELPVSEELGKPIEVKGREKSYKGNIRLLSSDDLDKILELENKTNLPEFQAGAGKILYRFSRQNQMIGFELENGKLVASAAWRYAIFSPEQPEQLPQTFEEYSTPIHFPPSDFNAMFHYGINIDPKIRKDGAGMKVGKEIFKGLMAQGTASGCAYFVSDPRLHTYNGSTAHPEIEWFPRDEKLREAVNNVLAGEREFMREDALRDPAFRVYSRIMGNFTLLKLMPNTWFPPDIPSGGHGFYVYKAIG